MDGNKHQASYTFLVTDMFMLTCCAATKSFHATLNDNRRNIWWVGPLRIGSGIQGIIFACSGGRGSNSATLWLNSGEVECEHGGFDSWFCTNTQELNFWSIRRLVQGVDCKGIALRLMKLEHDQARNLYIVPANSLKNRYNSARHLWQSSRECASIMV